MKRPKPSATVIAAPPETGMGNLFGGARDPAKYPLPPASSFDCPTGTGDNSPCSIIARNQKYAIEPFSMPHVARNACNRCPTKPPFNLTIKARHPRTPSTTVVTDSEGNIWGMDSMLTAPIFHGDPGIGRRDAANATYRVKTTTNNRRAGWQCRYYKGVLDDTS